MDDIYSVLLNIIKPFIPVKHRAHLLDAFHKMSTELPITGVLIIKDSFYVCGIQDYVDFFLLFICFNEELNANY